MLLKMVIISKLTFIISFALDIEHNAIYAVLFHTFRILYLTQNHFEITFYTFSNTKFPNTLIALLNCIYLYLYVFNNVCASFKLLFGVQLLVPSLAFGNLIQTVEDMCRDGLVCSVFCIVCICSIISFIVNFHVPHHLNFCSYCQYIVIIPGVGI